MPLSVKTGGRENLKFIKSSYRWVNGDNPHSATHTHTHTSRTSLLHTFQSKTHIVSLLHLYFSFHPPSISASTSYIGSHPCTHVCCPTSHHTVLPSFCSCAELLWKKCPACVSPNTEAFSKDFVCFGPYSTTALVLASICGELHDCLNLFTKVTSH